jgi:hypothetical protein
MSTTIEDNIQQRIQQAIARLRKGEGSLNDPSSKLKTAICLLEVFHVTASKAMQLIPKMMQLIHKILGLAESESLEDVIEELLLLAEDVLVEVIAQVVSIQIPRRTNHESVEEYWQLAHSFTRLMICPLISTRAVMLWVEKSEHTQSITSNPWMFLTIFLKLSTDAQLIAVTNTVISACQALENVNVAYLADNCDEEDECKAMNKKIASGGKLVLYQMTNKYTQMTAKHTQMTAEQIVMLQVR